MEIPVNNHHQKRCNNASQKLTSRRVCCLVNSYQTVAEFEHVVAVVRPRSTCDSGIHCKGHIPERDDDELCILGPVFDVVGDNRYVSEVQSRVDLVHEVEWCGLGTTVNSRPFIMAKFSLP